MNKKMICKICGEKKTAKMFARDKRTKSGYAKICKECDAMKVTKTKPAPAVKKDPAPAPKSPNLKSGELLRNVRKATDIDHFFCPTCHTAMKITIHPTEITVNVK